MDVGDINRLDGKRHGTSLQTAHVEQILDKATQPVQRLLGGGKQLGPILITHGKI